MLCVVLLYSACTQFCNVMVYVTVSLTVGEKILEFSTTDKAKGEENICGSDGRSLVITLYLFVLFLASFLKCYPFKILLRAIYSLSNDFNLSFFIDQSSSSPPPVPAPARTTATTTVTTNTAMTPAAATRITGRGDTTPPVNVTQSTISFDSPLVREGTYCDLLLTARHVSTYCM